MLEDEFEALLRIDLFVVGDFDNAVQDLSGLAIVDCLDRCADGVLVPQGPEVRPGAPYLPVIQEEPPDFACRVDGSLLVRCLDVRLQVVPRLGLDQRHSQFMPLLHQARLEDQRIGALLPEPLHGEVEASLDVA